MLEYTAIVRRQTGAHTQDLLAPEATYRRANRSKSAWNAKKNALLAFEQVGDLDYFFGCAFLQLDRWQRRSGLHPARRYARFDLPANRCAMEAI